MMRKILMMCSVLLLVPLAADAVEVKLINTGRMTWNIFDYGYWIEYEIDGKRLRSDTNAGPRTNQLAWELMSEEDKLKVIEAYGMGGSNARREQFGTDGAQKIADKVNDDSGWTEAWNAFSDRLAKRDFPTLEAIFRDEETRSAYFSANYAADWSGEAVPEYTDEMHQLEAEQTLVWGWACTTYEAIKTANERRIQTAAQALSGDLIALICDKVLVPNITFKNPIELGFKYGFRKEVLGALFDYVNSISQAGDKLVESVVGERASGESGAKIIAKLTDMVNMDLRFINQCRQRLSQNKAEIERLGAEALKKKREADAARSKALAAFAEERKQGEPTGEPADEGIRQANAEYRSQIDLLVKQLEKTTDEEKRKDLEAEIAEANADKTGYNQQLLDNLDVAFREWYDACLAEYTSWTNSDPLAKGFVVLSRYASDILAGSSAYAGPSAYDISDAEAEGVVSELKAHAERLKAAHAELPEWVKKGNELVETYRSSYDALLSDLHAVDSAGCHGTEVGRDLADSLLKRLSSVGGVASVEQASCQAAIDRCESRVQRYIEARALKKEYEAKFAAKRAEILASVQLAVIEYVNANGVLTNQLAHPPAFLAGLSTTYGILNPIPQSSKLWQDVYGGNPNGDAVKMRQYCRELNDYYVQYLSNRQKVDDAFNNMRSYVSACHSHGIDMLNEAGWVDLRIMPPACYETLNLVQALIRDFNVQDREGRLLDYYVILANNEDYYAEKRDQFVRAVKSSVRQSANVSAEELPTYAQICSGIVSLMNNPTGFADGIKGYSPDEAGGVFDLLITPIQSAIEGRRNALSWYYSIEGGQAKVFGVEGEVSGTVVIPEAFEGSPVTELGDYLFTGSDMTAVVIPESVVTIGSCAFSACRQLGAVRIPAKVASIGESAFAGCDTLMKFEVAADNAAYRAVNGLLFAKGGTDPIAGIGGDVTVPPGVKRIGTEIFYERSLGSVVLPPGVVEIGERAFAYSTLREITIPASVTTIAGDAFYSCDQLVTVYVDMGDNDRVRELLRDAGASLSRITIVSEFTETVDGIEWSYATANGEAVVASIAEKPEGESYGKVEVPSTLGGLPVTAIGNSVFMWRSDITEVTIPQGVRSIGDYAFNSSPSIKTVTLPRSLTQVGNLTFAYSSLTTVRTAPGDTARMKSLMTKGGLSVSVNWVENDDPAERPEIIDTPTDGAVPQGRCVSLDFEKVLGLEVPADVDYAAGDKVTIKVEGLAKGLKLVTTPVYGNPEAKPKVIVGYKYMIEGVPTESIDFDTQTMYARVTVTYKDKTKGDKGKVELLQPIVLSITTPEPTVLTAGVLNEVYEPVDIATLWPEVADAKVNPKDWSFKGWPAGLKYANGVVSGKPTKAGVFPITATWKHKLADGKTTVSETFSAVVTVWGDDGASSFRYTDQAYVATAMKMLAGVTAVSGLPAGINFDKVTASLSGTPTKAGVFAVTVTQTDNTKKTFLWKIDPPDAPTFALDMGTAPVEALKAQIVQGANQAFAIATSVGAKVTAAGLPTGLKLVQNKTTKLYTVEGIASKPGEYFVTFKTTLNGVTTVTTTAFTVKGNPFTAAYYGCALARPATNEAYRLAVAEVTVAAAGTVTLTYTEGKTKYTANVKSFDWNDTTGKGTASNIVLKVSSADKKLGYGDRKATLTFEDCGVYLRAKLIVNDANGSQIGESIGGMYATVKTTEVPLPASQTFVFRTEDGADTNAFATVSLAYDAKKATAAFSGKLYDGTAVKATVPVMRWDDDGKAWDYAFAPFLVVAKDGTVCCFNCFTDDDGGCINWVCDDGEWTEGVWSPDVDYPHADKKFAELVPEEGAFTFGWGSDAGIVGADAESFAFEVTTDAKGNPAGVAIYDADPQPGEKPLATVTAKMGKATGAISVSFTSKKGDKAKYAVELVWRGDKLFAGHVTRTWKDGKISCTAYGTAEVK